MSYLHKSFTRQRRGGASRQDAGPTTAARSAAAQPSVVSTPLEMRYVRYQHVLCCARRFESVRGPLETANLHEGVDRYRRSFPRSFGHAACRSRNLLFERRVI